MRTNTPISPNGSSDLTFHVLARLLIYVYSLFSFSYVTADPDLWGHIKFGGDIWTQGGFPETDPYSYTAGGHPWINHEWLMEVLFYFVYRFFGSSGLLFLKAAIGLGIIHLLSNFYFKRARNYTVYFATFFLIAPVMAPGFMTRPQLATFFFLTLLILNLQRFFEGHSRAIVWVPVILWLWANSHGGVVAGLGIFGLITIIELVRGRFREARGIILLKYLAISTLAVLINPYGFDLWRFFLHSLGSPRPITEWAPVPLLSSSHWQYKLLTLAFVITWFLPTKKRGWEMVVLTGALLYGYKHQRHTVLTVILLATYLPLQYAEWARRVDVERAFHRLSNHFKIVLNALLGTFVVVQLVYLHGIYASNRFKIQVDPKMYPTYAAQFMAANNINGNMAVPFDWGEYMIWKRPQSRVSIDGRFRTAYPEAIIQLNHAFAHAQPQGWALLDNFPTDVVLTSSREPAHHAMETREGWVKVYQDPTARIFLRENPPHPFLKELAQRPATYPPEPPPLDFPG